MTTEPIEDKAFLDREDWLHETNLGFKMEMDFNEKM